MTPAWTWKYRGLWRLLRVAIIVTGGVAVVMAIDVFVDWVAGRR